MLAGTAFAANWPIHRHPARTRSCPCRTDDTPTLLTLERSRHAHAAPSWTPARPANKPPGCRPEPLAPTRHRWPGACSDHATGFCACCRQGRGATRGLARRSSRSALFTALAIAGLSAHRSDRSAAVTRAGARAGGPFAMATGGESGAGPASPRGSGPGTGGPMAAALSLPTSRHDPAATAF